MHRLALLIFLPLLLSASCAADRVTCYTLWDDFYFYAAFEVQDSDVQSTNTKHMSSPWEDDSVEVFLETDAKRAPNRTPQTFQMAVSAGGGSSFVVGDAGLPKPKTIYTFKYAKKVQGTLNRSSDKDIGYTIELAIPWKEMGGPPAPGTVMGFNVLCRMKGENTGFVSFSPDVQTDDDVHVPAKWGSVKLSTTPTIIARQDGAIVCRRVASRPPLIDGNLGPGEWIRDMSFQIVKPEPTKRKDEEFGVERLALTHYFYWYQGDERKEAPFGHVRYEDGASQLTDHPLDSAGPWFSHDRVQWHKDQLRQIRSAGIDVIIPIYWGSAAQKREFASKGLNCMVQAMKELKAAGEGYPLVGMFYDTSAMSVQYGDKPDLRQDEVKQTFYAMIKDFFLQIPDEFRAGVQVPVEKGGYQGYVVVLYTASWFSDFDPSFVEYCNRRFAEDFGGRRLVWIGGSDYHPKAAVMDGYCNYGGGLNLQYDDAGWINVGAVGAGFDDTAVRGGLRRIRSRMAGDTYKKDWDELIARSPNWVLVDGWNELHEGSELCPTIEYGDRYVSRTKINMLRFNGMRPFDAKFLKHDTPSTTLPGAIYQVTLAIRNAGTKPWYPGQGIFLACRWFKDGQLFSDTGARLPFQESVLAGQIARKTMGIRTVDSEGKPLPEGDYELRWEMVRGRDEWFSSGGDMPLRVPVKVGAPSPGFTLAGSTLPAHMKSGATYNVTVRLRNDGPAAWKAGSAKIGYRWYRASVHLGTDSEDSAELLAACESAATLQADVEPGHVVEVSVPVMAASPDGAPMAVWTQKDLWTYLLRWDVFDGEKWLAPQSIGVASESVKVVADDLGPRFIASDAPAEMSAGKQYSVNVTVENSGVDVWTAADFAVGYHWYYADGIEAQWDGAKTPLPADVRPGERAIIKAAVTPPPYDGTYYLVWDLAHGDKWASTTANTRGGDILVVRASVVKGRLTPVSLDKLFDSDVASFDTNPKDGDFDGKGSTFPAEFLPAEDQLWPCGMWTSVQGKGPESSRRISFKFPPRMDGLKNAVTCKGQSIEVKPGRYAAVHLMLAASEKTTGEFVLAHKGGKSSVTGTLNAWNEAPGPDQHPAFVCLHRHSPSGDQRDQDCYLTHLTLRADPNAELAPILLPNNPAIKILALTLEKAD
jgi:hypothetical protein